MTDKVAPEFVAQLAKYAELPLPSERAEAIAEILGPALAKLRAIHPPDYIMLAPDLNFRVPSPLGDDCSE